jgi:hypothetical protein
VAESGISLDADLVQVYQGVTSGGLNTTFKYGGHADYVLQADLDRLAGLKGAFLKMLTETLFGEALGFGDTGTVLPPAVITNIPRPEENQTAITNLSITQFISESFGVFFGKVDTFDGDSNAFASGRGKDQFLNSSLAFNPVAARTVPYSTLGVGLVVLQDHQPIFTFAVLDPVDLATTSGLDLLYEKGVALATELEPFERPVAERISPRVADVGDECVAPGRDGRGDRRPHACEARIPNTLLDQPLVHQLSVNLQRLGQFIRLAAGHFERPLERRVREVPRRFECQHARQLAVFR